MPAYGKLSIKNRTEKDQKKLVIKYSGTLDDVTCGAFANVTWGEGTIELANGTVERGENVRVRWRDRQGRGPAWKSIEWQETDDRFKKKVGDERVRLDRTPGAV